MGEPPGRCGRWVARGADEKGERRPEELEPKKINRSSNVAKFRYTWAKKKTVKSFFSCALSTIWPKNLDIRSWVNLTFIGGPPGPMNLNTRCVISVTHAAPGNSLHWSIPQFSKNLLVVGN
jgi:hypothetical protein